VNQDFIDFLTALLHARAQFLVVGTHALGAHGVSRATGDIDIWINNDPKNVDLVWNAIIEFGAPVSNLGISKHDFLVPDMVVQFGVPPRRIDVLTGISGVAFREAWENRFVLTMYGLDIPFLGREAFIKNKIASGRLKDLADVEALGEHIP
jgi:hypothetical protein